jgi:uncharacterized alkaline shock family protein YloU
VHRYRHAVDGQSLISPDVVARYARDAALEVPGVLRVVEGVRKGVRVEPESIELHLAVAFGASIPEVGSAVQQHVVDYLARMTAVHPAVVNVVVEAVDGVS